MKLRIKGNSVRLRVSPSEVRRLLQSGHVEETVHFAPAEEARLTYAIELSADTRAISIRYQPQQITVVLPRDQSQRWAEGNDVGLYQSSESGHGPLDLAVEKDFACIDSADADNSDTYPNPKQGAVC